jgi:hypothetical protein
MAFYPEGFITEKFAIPAIFGENAKWALNIGQSFGVTTNG